MLLVLPGLAALALVGVLVVYGGVLAAGVVQPWLLEMSVLTAAVGLLASSASPPRKKPAS